MLFGILSPQPQVLFARDNEITNETLFGTPKSLNVGLQQGLGRFSGTDSSSDCNNVYIISYPPYEWETEIHTYI
jgi:hypothetical protein